MKYFTPVGIAIILAGLYPFDFTWGIAFQVFHPYFFEMMVIPAVGGLAMLATWGRIVSLFVCGECNRIFLSEHQLRVHFSSNHVKKDSGKDSPK